MTAPRAEFDALFCFATRNFNFAAPLPLINVLMQCYPSRYPVKIVRGSSGHLLLNIIALDSEPYIYKCIFV